MSLQKKFPEITRCDEPLGPRTWLKVGGVAQWFVEPRTLDELKSVVSYCKDNEITVRLLGGGSNLLVRDEGVSGAVIHLSGEEFSRIEVEKNIVRAGGAALLSNVVSRSVAAGLAGLENLVGIPGTIAGAVRGNAGSRHGEIGQFVRSATVMTFAGEQFTRRGDELTFGYRYSSVNELVISSVELELTPDDPNEISRRMRKLWIMKKATQPLSFQSAGCIFKNPRGLSAGALIEQAGLKGARVGHAEVSDRHGNFIVTSDGATAADVLNLVDLIRSRVSEVHGISLELEIQVW